MRSNENETEQNLSLFTQGSSFAKGRGKKLSFKEVAAQLHLLAFDYFFPPIRFQFSIYSWAYWQSRPLARRWKLNQLSTIAEQQQNFLFSHSKSHFKFISRLLMKKKKKRSKILQKNCYCCLIKKNEKFENRKAQKKKNKNYAMKREKNVRKVRFHHLRKSHRRERSISDGWEEAKCTCLGISLPWTWLA